MGSAKVLNYNQDILRARLHDVSSKNAKGFPLRFQNKCGFTLQQSENDGRLHGNVERTENAVVCMPGR